MSHNPMLVQWVTLKLWSESPHTVSDERAVSSGAPTTIRSHCCDTATLLFSIIQCSSVDLWILHEKKKFGCVT